MTRSYLGPSKPQSVLWKVWKVWKLFFCKVWEPTPTIRRIVGGDAAMPSLPQRLEAFLTTPLVCRWPARDSLPRSTWLTGVGRSGPERRLALAFPPLYHVSRGARPPLYDVSRVLGCVLSSKYDFTSVQGIIRAYKAVFKTESTLESPGVESDLRKLEAVRHVIVHNAAIADQAFVDRIGQGYSVGDPILLTGSQLRAFALAVRTAGKSLLTTADQWMSLASSW